MLEIALELDISRFPENQESGNNTGSHSAGPRGGAARSLDGVHALLVPALPTPTPGVPSLVLIIYLVPVGIGACISKNNGEFRKIQSLRKI